MTPRGYVLSRVRRQNGWPRGVSNLPGYKTPMQFASSIFMSDWRALHHATVVTGDAFYICMSKYMPGRAQPYMVPRTHQARTKAG
jgi:hypothetical protein